MKYPTSHITPLLRKTTFITDIIISAAPSTFESGPAAPLIDSGWESATSLMAQKNWPFYDGPLFRFENIEEHEDHITILASPSISYKDIVGMRAHPYEDFLDIPQHLKPNALSTINVIVTNDGMIPLGWRTSGDWEESYELSGGFVRTDETSLFQSTLRRLADDFSIEQDQIAGHQLITIAHIPPILETMAIFGIRVDLSIDELSQKDHRYTKITHVPFSKDAWERTKQEYAVSPNERLHAPSQSALDLVFSLS